MQIETLVKLPQKLETSVRSHPVLAQVLNGWEQLGIPNCWLVAGAVVQSYWNSVHGYSPIHGFDDIDLIYFDPGDLTEESELQNANRIGRLHGRFGIKFDVKNQARVHLWYAERFGYSIAAYTSSQAAIETFPTTAGAIGIRPAGRELEAFAPFGFDDLLNLVVRPNKRQITSNIYAEKIARWKSCWPRLRIVDWNGVTDIPSPAA